jgi:dTMP kinase
VHDRLESEADVFHAAVRQGFLALAARDPGRYLVVDAALPVDEIHGLVVEAVTRIDGAASTTAQGAR